MAYKQIQVTEETHAKITQIARENYRGIGDQVSLWADKECEHPQEQRELVNIVVAPVIPPARKGVAQVGKDQPYRGFFCNKCGQYIFVGSAVGLLADSMNAPLVGKTSKV